MKSDFNNEINSNSETKFEHNTMTIRNLSHSPYYSRLPLSSPHHHHHHNHRHHHPRSMERRTSSPNNSNHKRSRSRLIPPAFVKLTATTPTNHDYPNGKNDHNANQEALEKLFSRRSRDYFNLFDEGNCTNDVSIAIYIDREIPSTSDTTEKKTNNNTIRVNEMKNILKVTPQFLHANYNNTNNICTYDTDTKYSSKVDRYKDKKKYKTKRSTIYRTFCVKIKILLSKTVVLF